LKKKIKEERAKLVFIILIQREKGFSLFTQKT